jgi:hypothetical protein
MCSVNFKDIFMAFRAWYQVYKYLTDFAVLKQNKQSDFIIKRKIID